MKISIALCTYNGEKYLEAQLDSMMSQTVKADEIVICDDGSKDLTIQILQHYDRMHSGLFKIFLNEKNLGYSRNFEKAISNCTGDIIIISDQDDIWNENKIEKTKAFFSEHPNADGVFHDLEIINDDQKILEPSYLNWKNISYDFVKENIRSSHLFIRQQTMGSFVLGCALALRQSALKKYELHNFETAHDYLISQKLAAKNKLGFIPETLSKYRQHEKQVCGLREAFKNPEKKQGNRELSEFQKKVGPSLLAIKKYTHLYPTEDVTKTDVYRIFTENRNSYLMNLPFFERKKYILQCIRYQYLDLNITDLFKY
jgi:glycosyltransferase involved in cell wall biosynthesis